MKMIFQTVRAAPASAMTDMNAQGYVTACMNGQTMNQSTSADDVIANAIPWTATNWRMHLNPATATHPSAHEPHKQPTTPWHH